MKENSSLSEHTQTCTSHDVPPATAFGSKLFKALAASLKIYIKNNINVISDEI
jgi:hypothetical protein